MRFMKQTLRILLTTLTLSLLAEVQGVEKVSLPAAASDPVSARPKFAIATLGFGACARQERPQPIWDTINAAGCDAFVLLGDNIYADTTDPVVFREKYALLAAMPGFVKLRQTTPLFATWDDHDDGINDGGAGFPGAATAQKEFCDFFQVPATSPLRNTPGVYDCVTVGPDGKRVQVILLDTRMFRSPTRPCSAKRSGPGSSVACANRPKSAWWFPAFSWSRPSTVLRSGRTFPRNALVSWSSSVAPRPKAWSS
jgi:alkaline phosphatase D